MTNCQISLSLFYLINLHTFNTHKHINFINPHYLNISFLNLFFLGSRWKRFDLTYNVVNLPYDMHRQTVYNEFKKAFNYWTSVSPLKFRRVSSNADINVAFYSGRHGDSDAFDGSGGTLAHSFFPRYIKHFIMILYLMIT